MNSIAQAELHGEIFFAFFEGGLVAMLAHDAALTVLEREMRGGDCEDGDDHAAEALFGPRFND
jgi:hypothetical protein